jgi:transcriptional regulator with XRE-family HTH domain
MGQASKSKTAREFSELFRSDPERERLYRESQIRFGLSDRMTEMRKQQGLSQVELAERVGCRQSFIAKLEGGAYDKCEMSTLRTFASAMGHDINISLMFYPLQAAFFTGKSSAGELESVLFSQDILCESLSSIAVARWSRGGTDVLRESTCSSFGESATAA